MDDRTRALLIACGRDPDRPPSSAEWSAFLADMDAAGERLRASVDRMRASLTPSELAVLALRFPRGAREVATDAALASLVQKQTQSGQDSARIGEVANLPSSDGSDAGEPGQ
jgi:hypothetical protein